MKVARVLFAVVGWLVLSAQHPSPVNTSQPLEVSQSIEIGLSNASALFDEKSERVHRANYEAQCEPGDERRASELCAQWKAADASANAATWAKIGTWVSGVSGLFVLVALALAYHANRIASDTAKRQLRAYVHVKRCWLEWTEEGEVVAHIIQQNFDQTPALDFQGWDHTWTASFPLESPLPDAPDDLPKSKNVLSPGNFTESTQADGAPLSAFNRQGIEAGLAAFYVYGKATYKDIFGRTHRTEYLYFARGAEALNEGRVAAYTEGNICD